MRKMREKEGKKGRKRERQLVLMTSSRPLTPHIGCNCVDSLRFELTQPALGFEAPHTKCGVVSVIAIHKKMCMCLFERGHW